jgi:heterodisulfide reductase subunit A
MSKAVLIIGAGIAGIEASLNLAAYSLKVYLVDDTPSIGGLMARLDKTFPTNDCSICIEAPKMYEVQKNPNIELLTNCEIRRVQDTAGNFHVRLSWIPLNARAVVNALKYARLRCPMKWTRKSAAPEN